MLSYELEGESTVEKSGVVTELEQVIIIYREKGRVQFVHHVSGRKLFKAEPTLGCMQELYSKQIVLKYLLYRVLLLVARRTGWSCSYDFSKSGPLDVDFYSNFLATLPFQAASPWNPWEAQERKCTQINLKGVKILICVCTIYKGTSSPLHKLRFQSEGKSLKTLPMLPRTSSQSPIQLLIPCSLRDCISLTV